MARSENEPTLTAEPVGLLPPGASAEGSSKLRPGDVLGRYLVLEEVGAGGMGVVYAAHDQELRRKVALKLLRVNAGRELDITGGYQRVRHEAQVMAQLSHPNVITVFDVGRVGERVFLAMEFVEGRTLKAWLSECDRSWREVLEAFLQAGRGLAAAHGVGLVHRDFKPDNVLLGAGGRVQVTDFGLAHSDEAHSTSNGAASVAEQDHSSSATSMAQVPGWNSGSLLVGTPPYMAPEQHRGEPTSFATDQYSFCVALFEGLYGQRPFGGDDSKALARAKQDGAVIPAGSGRQVPARIGRALLRGLSPRPEDRWASMNDLLSVLGHDPWVARRKAGLFCAMGLTVTVALGSVHYVQSSQAALCGGGIDRVEHVWNDATRERVRHAILQTKLDYADETWSKTDQRLSAYGEDWARTHREVCEATAVLGEQSDTSMDLKMACLDDRLAEVAALVQVLGSADVSVTERALDAVYGLRSIDQCTDARRLHPYAPPPDAITEDVEEVRQTLAEVGALQATGRYERGLELSAIALERADAIAYEPLQARALFLIGILEEDAGNFAASEEQLRRALWMAFAHKDDDLVVSAALALAFTVIERRGKVEQGELWLEAAQAAVTRLGNRDVDRARLMHNRGNLLELRGDFDGARDLHEDAHAILTAAPDSSPGLLAGSFNLLGNVQSVRGEHEAALATFEEALSLAQEGFGHDHPTVGKILVNLGRVANDLGDAERAVGYYERAEGLLVPALGSDHSLVASLRNNHGVVLLEQGDLDGARPLFEAALPAMRKTLGDAHPYLSMVQNNLGTVEFLAGNHGAAMPWYRKTVDVLERAGTPDAPEMAIALLGLADIEFARGEHEIALQRYERARTILEAAGGDQHAGHVNALVGIGLVEDARGNSERALEVLERAQEIAEKDPSGRLMPDVLIALGRVSWTKADDRPGARALVLEGLRRARALGPAGAVATSTAQGWLRDHPPS